MFISRVILPVVATLLLTMPSTEIRASTVLNPGLQLILSTDKAVYSVGDDPKIRIMLVNHSAHEIKVPNYDDYGINLIDPDGDYLASTAALDTHHTPVQLVEPGESLPITLSLATLGFDVKKAGTYTLYIKAGIALDGKRGAVPSVYTGGNITNVTSNRVTFKVA